MRKHEISKGVPKFVAMLAPNFKATLSYSIIANLCNFEYDFLIQQSKEYSLTFTYSGQN